MCIRDRIGTQDLDAGPDQEAQEEHVDPVRRAQPGRVVDGHRTGRPTARVIPFIRAMRTWPSTVVNLQASPSCAPEPASRHTVRCAAKPTVISLTLNRRTSDPFPTDTTMAMNVVRVSEFG